MSAWPYGKPIDWVSRTPLPMACDRYGKPPWRPGTAAKISRVSTNSSSEPASHRNGIKRRRSQPMRIDLQDHVTIITGGAKGIGRSIAEAFAKVGSNLIVIGRDTAALRTAVSELICHGVRADFVTADITREAELDALRTLIETQYDGRVDTIVTSAGTRDHMAAPVSDILMSDFDAVMQGNLNGSLLPIRSVLPYMKSRSAGRIIAISGVFGLKGRANHAAGCASKWALEGLIKVLALELGPHNINVNA